MDRWKAAAVGLAVTALAGCAKPRTYTIAPEYVSAAPYEALTCPQLAQERQRLRPALASALGAANYGLTHGLLGMAYGGDAAVAQAARLKGIRRAVYAAQTFKNCGAPPERTVWVPGVQH